MTKYDISDLKPLVQKGAKFLDELKPIWFKVFTPKQLTKFSSPDNEGDVLGSVFGSYQTGIRLLFEGDYNKGALYGFDLPHWSALNYTKDSNPWEDLTSLWLEEIVDRQENGVPE